MTELREPSDWQGLIAEEVHRINGEKRESYNDEMKKAHAETEAYRRALREIANRADIAVESLDWIAEYCRSFRISQGVVEVSATSSPSVLNRFGSPRSTLNLS